MLCHAILYYLYISTSVQWLCKLTANTLVWGFLASI